MSKLVGNDEAARRVLGYKPESCWGHSVRVGFNIVCDHCSFTRPATEAELSTDGSGHDHLYPAPDMTSPQNQVAMIEWLVRERDVPVVEDGETYLMPEQYHPEIWFGEERRWHIRIDSWADTFIAKTLAAALIAVVVSVPEVE